MAMPPQRPGSPSPCHKPRWNDRGRNLEAETSRARLSTPPPHPRTLTAALSPNRTPLSHRGLHMSPSPSLAHYKSNLDPPPIASVPGFSSSPREGVDSSEPEGLRTPSRKTGPSLSTPRARPSTIFPPVTPMKRIFPPSGDSPFRTPGPGSPSKMYMYDPHDPTALLDDEWNRLTAANSQESPLPGLFPRLYESPSVPSPSKFANWL